MQVVSRRATPPAMPAAAAAKPPRIREVPAVHRANAILWHLARHPNGLTLSSIARDLGIIPSTCLHILRELVNGRLVAYDSSAKLYSLGLGVLGLANGLRRHDPFIQAAQPRLGELARELAVSATALQLDGEEFVVVAVATADEGLAAALGGRAPCLASSVGRVFAAHSGWAEGELLERFQRVRWTAAPDYKSWLREIAAVRTDGYAIDEGQFRRGITSIAAPVAGAGGRVRRVISITAVSAQLDPRRRARYIKALKASAAEITAQLHDSASA